MLPLYNADFFRLVREKGPIIKKYSCENQFIQFHHTVYVSVSIGMHANGL